jgi:hypothetical protein
MASGRPNRTLDRPRRWFSTPYTLREQIEWLWWYFLGPTRDDAGLTSFLPRRTVLNPVTPRLILAFAGDVMPAWGRAIAPAPEVAAFLRGADFFLANLEGAIGSARRVFLAQVHDASVLGFFEALFPPERTVLSCANNHAGDFSRREFEHSCAVLRDRGFRLIGLRDAPSALVGGAVNVAAATWWSNHPCDYVVKPDDLDGAFRPGAAMNVLFPHWGPEGHRYPAPRWVEEAARLLARWDMIVGHHSHCPEPVAAVEARGRRRLVAYSLGNLSSGWAPPHFRWGIVLKAAVGPDAAGIWQVGAVEWSFTTVRPTGRGRSRLDLAPRCPYFDV